MAPRISIVMPAYNAEKYIEASISSVIAQSVSDWELIIVNDGSTDATQDIVIRFGARDSRIILINQPNRKQAAARNNGIRHATGEWLAFLDADDTWSPSKLKEQLEVSHLADVIYSGGVKYIEDTGLQETYPSVPGSYTGSEMFRMLYERNPIPNLSVIVRSDWVKRVGFQNEHPAVVGCEDWEYWIRLAKNGASFLGLDRELFVYRVHQAGTSRNRLRMKIARVYAKALNLNASSDDPKAAVMFTREVDRLLQVLLWKNMNSVAIQIIEQSRNAGSRRYGFEYYLLELRLKLHGKLVLACSRPLSFVRRLLAGDVQ